MHMTATLNNGHYETTSNSRPKARAGRRQPANTASSMIQQQSNPAVGRRKAKMNDDDSVLLTNGNNKRAPVLQVDFMFLLFCNICCILDFTA